MWSVNELWNELARVDKYLQESLYVVLTPWNGHLSVTEERNTTMLDVAFLTLNY